MVDSFKDIINKFDFQFTDGAVLTERVNVVVRNCCRSEDDMTLFQVTCVAPSGVSSSRLASGLQTYCNDQDRCEAWVKWGPDRLPPSPEGMYALIGAKANPVGCFDFHVDANCTPVLMNKPTDSCLRVLELCSGAFGGWSKACDFLSNKFGLNCRVLSVDSDLESSWHLAVAHGAVLVDSPSAVSMDFLSSCSRMVLCADLATPSWLMVAGNWGVDVATFSPPCQPWSTAGSSTGLDSLDGATFGEGIAACKVLRPRVLLVEQVTGFAQHSHKEMILKLLRWAGYVVKFAKCIDAGDVLPVSRARFLLMATRADDDEIRPLDFQMWTSIAGLTPLSFGAVLSADWTCDNRLQITQDIRKVASDPELVPNPKRVKMAPEVVFETRCKSVHTKVQTIVASYGSQHNLPQASLAAKGLMCHFVKEDGAPPRFWHPIELTLLHTHVGSHLVALDWKTAFRHVGNQICVPHALLVLTQAINWIPGKANYLDVDQVLQALHRCRVTCDNMHASETALGVFVSEFPMALLPAQKEHLEGFWTFLDGGKLPSGFGWTLDGFVPIFPCTTAVIQVDSSCELTQTAMVFMQVHCLGRPLCQLFVDKNLEFHLLGSVWNGCFDFFESNGVGYMLRALEDNLSLAPDVHLVLCQGKLFVLSQTSLANDWIRCQIGDNIRDLFGPLGFHELGFAFFIHDVPQDIPNPLTHTALAYVFAFHRCTVESFASDDLDDLGFRCLGSSLDVKIVIGFWSQVLPTVLLEALGFRVQVTEILNGVEVRLIASALTPCVPVRYLAVHLVIAAFRTLCVKISNGVRESLKIKLFDRLLWDGDFPHAWQLESLMGVLHSTCFWISPCLRVLAFGRQVDWRRTLHDLKGDRSQLRLSLLLPLRGGAPSTKLSHKTQVSNAIAGVLIEEGYDLKWAAQSVDVLTTKVPIKDLSKTLSASRDTRLQIARKFLKQCEIQLPDNKPSMTSQAAFLAKRAKPSAAMPNPSHYRVIEGSLINEDGTPTPFIPTFGGQLMGYHCVSPKDASPWLQGNQALSKDELVLLIFGEPQLQVARPNEKITLPCVDEAGNNVLVSCTMVQYGDKLVKCHSGDGHKVNSQDRTLLAMTVEYDDWKDCWSEISKFTFKFLQMIWSQFGDAVFDVENR